MVPHEGGRRWPGAAVAPGVEQDGAQPAAKASLRVVVELGQLAEQDDEDILDQVLSVGILQAEPAHPVKQKRSVELDEALPGNDIVGLPQLGKQTGGRVFHDDCTFRRNLTSPYHPQQAGEQGGEFPGEALAELSGEKLQLEAAAP